MVVVVIVLQVIVVDTVDVAVELSDIVTLALKISSQDVVVKTLVDEEQLEVDEDSISSSSSSSLSSSLSSQSLPSHFGGSMSMDGIFGPLTFGILGGSQSTHLTSQEKGHGSLSLQKLMIGPGGRPPLAYPGCTSFGCEPLGQPAIMTPFSVVELLEVPSPAIKMTVPSVEYWTLKCGGTHHVWVSNDGDPVGMEKVSVSVPMTTPPGNEVGAGPSGSVQEPVVGGFQCHKSVSGYGIPQNIAVLDVDDESTGRKFGNADED